MRILVRAIVLSFFAILLVPSQASAFTGGTVSGDVLISDTTRVLKLTSGVIIPDGSSLTIAEGVTLEIAHRDWAFQVGGKLTIGGNGKSSKIMGNAKSFIRMPANQQRSYVSIENVELSNVGETEVDGGTSFALKNSTIVGQSVLSFFYNSAISEVAGNRFFFSPKEESPGVNDNCKSFGLNISYPQSRVRIVNNTFSGGDGRASKDSCDSWINHALNESQKVEVEYRGNAFNTGQGMIGHFRSGATFVNTFFFSLPSGKTASDFVWDGADDLSLTGTVSFLDNLTALPASSPGFYEPALTPAPAPTSTPPKTAKPAPKPIKYKNCAALQKVYPGGVALSARWVNKGARLKLTPAVNARVYNLNRTLDRDKDGLACER